MTAGVGDHPDTHSIEDHPARSACRDLHRRSVRALSPHYPASPKWKVARVWPTQPEIRRHRAQIPDTRKSVIDVAEDVEFAPQKCPKKCSTELGDTTRAEGPAAAARRKDGEWAERAERAGRPPWSLPKRSDDGGATREPGTAVHHERHISCKEGQHRGDGLEHRAARGGVRDKTWGRTERQPDARDRRRRPEGSGPLSRGPQGNSTCPRGPTINTYQRGGGQRKSNECGRCRTSVGQMTPSCAKIAPDMANIARINPCRVTAMGGRGGPGRCADI